MEKIILRNVVKYYGDRKIVDINELKINQGEKIGIVGINGSGKSTLLNIISGKIESDGGQVIVNGKISYIEQSNGENTFLSGGEITKKKVEDKLNEYSDILLADEPSSNLDIDEIENLKRKLKEYKGTLLLISHDRNLLDSVVESILEIENGIVTKYKGNYSKYKGQKEESRKRKQFEYEQYITERKRLEVSINKVKNEAKSMRKTPKRMGNSEARLHKRGVENKREKVEQRSKSLETRLEKLQIKEKPDAKYNIFMKIPESLRVKSKYIIGCDNLNIKVENKLLLDNTNFNIKTNSKTALIGKNGVGKTTLIKEILNGNTNIKINPSSKISYFKQNLNNLDENKNIIENILRDTSQEETTIRNILASLNIKGDDIYKKVKVLSGGEKVKVSLTKIMTSNSNFIILDEPTNFLDIESIEALEYLMKEFKGTILFVTHDRNLIDNVATNIMIIENKKIIQFEGNYTKYLKYEENKKKCISSNDLLLDIKLAEITSKLSICKDEREKQKLEEEYMKLIKNKYKTKKLGIIPRFDKFYLFVNYKG